jgi:hypothetical protein
MSLTYGRKRINPDAKPGTEQSAATFAEKREKRRAMLEKYGKNPEPSRRQRNEKIRAAAKGNREEKRAERKAARLARRNK